MMSLLKKLFKKEAELDPNTIYNPIQGKAIPLSEVKDPVFSQEMMGKGVGIVPEIGRVVSPLNGVVATVFPTKHAIGIQGEGGAELIIHVGLDTVNLQGQHFKAHVKEGAKIKRGDLLLEFDMEKIKEAGYDLTTPVVVPNSVDYEEVSVKLGTMNEKEELIVLA